MAEPGKARAMEPIAVDGATLEYERVGSGEPVLLIHGAMLGRTFETIMQEPALSGSELIRYHRRGFCGSSPAEPPFSIADQAADAAALLDALGIESAHVVGHSYGAVIGLQFALDARERVRSLMLWEAPYIPGDEPPPPELLAALELFGKGDVAGAADLFSRFAVAEDYAETAAAAMPDAVDEIIRDAPGFFTVEMPALPPWELPGDAADRLDGLPLLYILSEHTQPIYPLTAEFLGAALPHMRVETMPGVDHGMLMQDPAGVARRIADFVSSA